MTGCFKAKIYLSKLCLLQLDTSQLVVSVAARYITASGKWK